MMISRNVTAILLCMPMLAFAESRRDDVTICDFNTSDFDGWTVEGDAFGSGPALGTLPNQMPVDGYVGGYASSYHGTDRTKGTLTSSRFTIKRDAITFLVGGGSHDRDTAINLIVDGKIVRTTTGSNSETLMPATWDVREFKDKAAHIQIVDRVEGGWGHITVDQIMQTDHPAVPPIVTSPLYQETYRPQFHFTSQKNWINDPNGCVYFDGEYHLFFQHNPHGREWGNMTWGHAVSPDLVRWTQLPDALEPDAMGTMFSGSAVVDHDNTSGFGRNGKPPLIAMYTAAGGTNPESKGKKFTQCIAYSTDRGRTWTKYPNNPVIDHIAGENRDPKLIWHAPTKRWICALFLEGQRFALFSSSDLKSFTKLQELDLPGTGECPDFFPLPVDSDPSKVKWVLTAADAGYLVGDFDGNRFTPDGGVLRVDAGRNNYAVQTWSDTPDGRRIQIGWLRDGKFPQMPFNGQMSFPATLELRSTPAGPRLFRNPIREIESLHDVQTKREKITLKPGGENPLADVTGDLFDIRLVIRPGAAKRVGLNIRGQQVVYDAEQQKLSALGDANVPLVNGVLKLQILVDRTTIETFANDGAAAFSSCFLPNADRTPLTLFAEGGEATVESATVWTLKSTWPAR